MKRIIALLAILILLFGSAGAETDEEQQVYFTVIASDALYCRAAPRKNSAAITSLENGQVISGTGKMSKDGKWIEIDHSEYGKLWCNYAYLTEREDPFYVETLWDSPLKIRKYPKSGTVTGYLKKGKEIEITQVVLGWGKCRQGWIDLSYCIEIEK